MPLSAACFFVFLFCGDENTFLCAVNDHLTRAPLVLGYSFVRVNTEKLSPVLDAGSSMWCARGGPQPERPLLVTEGRARSCPAGNRNGLPGAVRAPKSPPPISRTDIQLSGPFSATLGPKRRRHSIRIKLGSIEGQEKRDERG